MIHSISSADNASKPCLSRRPSAARKFFTTWTFFSMLIEISLLFPYTKCVRSNRTFGTIFLGPNHTVVDRLLLFLEQILEDEPTPSAAACVHQRATLVELSQLDGCEPKFFGQIHHGSDGVLVVARQKDDPMAPLDDRIGRQGGRNQVIKTFDELSAGEGLRSEGGGRETAQLGRAFATSRCSPNGTAKMTVSASSASRSDFATTVGPIARACGANASGGRRLATVTSMLLRAKAWARAWPILPNPTIA